MCARRHGLQGVELSNIEGRGGKNLIFYDNRRPFDLVNTGSETAALVHDVDGALETMSPTGLFAYVTCPRLSTKASSRASGVTGPGSPSTSSLPPLRSAAAALDGRVLRERGEATYWTPTASLS